MFDFSKHIFFCLLFVFIVYIRVCIRVFKKVCGKSEVMIAKFNA